MKKIFTLIAFLCVCLMIYSSSKVINVEYKDNTVVSVGLSPELTIQFVGDELVFESATSKQQFALADISGFCYAARSTSVEKEILTKSFVVTPDALQIVGLPQGTVVRVYNLDGVLVCEDRADDTYRLELARLTNGVYVVAYGQVARKIIVNRR